MRLSKRHLFLFIVVGLLLLTGVFLLASTGYASPVRDAGVPSPTPTVTLTPTIVPSPTLVPAPSETPTTIPYPVAPTATLVVIQPTQETAPGDSAVLEDGQAEAAGSSVLGFLLCAGIILVAGLAALNIWQAQRTP